MQGKYLPISREKVPQDAVAAILIRENGQLVMQLRDNNPKIFYPNHWGCFGGAIDSGESEVEACKREIEEELCIQINELFLFTTLYLDFSVLGHGKVSRTYFICRLSNFEYENIVLNEGSAIQSFDGIELLSEALVTPYDSFVLAQYLALQK